MYIRTISKFLWIIYNSKENVRNPVKIKYQRRVNSECLGLKYFQVIISKRK